jgi:hypothetical protein
MSETGSATCRPVRICGSAAGSMICQTSARPPAPMLRADQTSSRSTPCRPARVAVTTGKIASSTTMAILVTSKKPSQRIMIGRNAILGIGKPTEMIGSKNQRMGALRDIAQPSATPAPAAIKKPASAR